MVWCLHIVDFAENGLTGLHLAVTNSYNVIVLDLTLLGMDGLEVCRKLRESSLKPVSILMLTARNTIENVVQGFEAGADDYLIMNYWIYKKNGQSPIINLKASPRNKHLKRL